MILPVIIAGGSGSRLWPLSRTHYPKQFHSLISDKSLLIDTLKRLENIDHVAPLIICNEEHRFLVAEQLRQNSLISSGIILEPIGKNTCPAIALAAFQAIRNGDDPFLLVLAADHAITDCKSFEAAISAAYATATRNMLVTFGIVPSAPETGYGYIKKGDVLDNNAFQVEQFKEKPDLATAEEYIKSKAYLWNSGMFLFKASTFLNELQAKAPEIFSSCSNAIKNAIYDMDFVRIDNDAFYKCKSESIDYAIMEKTDKCAVVPLDAGWNDVGSWSALWELSHKDEQNNYHHGDIISISSSNNYIRSEERLTVTLGIRDLVIVNTKDALLIAERAQVQQVKDVVELLKAQHRKEFSHYSNEYRSWGEIETIDRHEGYIVNRLTVNPGGKITKQIHYHRSEHWIVVSGTAQVTIDDKTFILAENESSFIRPGQAHAIINPGIIPLKLIEIQSGKLIDDIDIVRIAEK